MDSISVTTDEPRMQVTLTPSEIDRLAGLSVGVMIALHQAGMTEAAWLPWANLSDKLRHAKAVSSAYRRHRARSAPPPA